MSDHQDLLLGHRVDFPETGPFATLDAESEWYLLPTSPVKNEDGAKDPYFEKFASSLKNKDQLRIHPRTGIGHIVPVTSMSKVWVECRGSFSVEDMCTAAVVQLPTNPEDIGSYLSSFVKRLLIKNSLPMQLLRSFDGGNSVHGTVIVLPGTKSLLVIFSANGETAGLLERVEMSYLGEVKSDLLSKRIREGIVHPGLALQPFIEATVRPSLFVPPKTSITFKEVTVPGGAELSGTFGVAEEFDVPVTLALTGRDDEGKDHEIFNKSFDPPSKGWIELKEDLAHIGGKRVKFTLSCDWTGEKVKRPLKPPMVCCGSPAILYMDRSRPEPVNLVLISLDTLRWDRLGCYGYDRPVSPNIDAFAGNNILFEKVYAHSDHTLSSHASLFTSLYPSVHGLLFTRSRLAEKVELMAEILARHGFATASFNNGGMISHEFGYHRGFDIYCEVDPIGHRSTYGRAFNPHRLADGSAGSLDRAFAWIDSKREAPFFLFLHTFMIHCYRPPLDLARIFAPEQEGRYKDKREVQTLLRRYMNFRKNGVPPEDLAYLQNMYDATIRAADDMVGEVLEHLERSGLLDRTVVLVTSDHGEEFMEHGNLGHAKSVYEESIRVPLIMGVPDMQGGRRVKCAVSHVDVMPTVLELLGVESPDLIQGRSLTSLLRGKDGPDRPIYAEVELPRWSHRRCLIRNGWKYIEGDTDEKLKYAAPAESELYSLADDPEERRNLTGNRPEVTKKLNSLLRNLQTGFQQSHDMLDTGGKDSSAISEELKKVLRQQGYL